MRDYTNKTIYIGIDAHKKTYAVTVICDNGVVKKDLTPLHLQSHLSKNAGKGVIPE